MVNAPLFQLPAHDPGQRIHFRFSQVRHLKAGGVQLISGAHGADDGHTGLFCLDHQRDLPRNGINGIHDVIILGEIELIYCVHHIIVLVKGKIRRRFRQKEAVVLGDLGRRIDV